MYLINKNAIKNKIQHYKVAFGEVLARYRHKSEDINAQNEKVDEASRESFPASDPPAHISRSSEDKVDQRAP